MTGRKAVDVAAGLATDLGAGWVVQGVVHYLSTTDTHTIAGKDVDFLLAKDAGREVLVVVLAASEWAPTRICPYCWTLYSGAGCLECVLEDY